MTGRFRRAILLRAEPGAVTGEVEDDFHHFVVRVRHDGRQVTGIEGRAVRYPWSLCPAAARVLDELAGHPLAAHPAEIYRRVDPRSHCTHMLELAGLAVLQASRGTGVRRYDITVGDPLEGRVEADLARDETPLHRWVLVDGAVADPAALAGLRPAELRSADLARLTAEEAEVLLMLRRAVVLAAARGVDVDRFPTAAAMGRGRACYVFSPGVAEMAQRRRGSVRDFQAGRGPLAEAR